MIIKIETKSRVNLQDVQNVSANKCVLRKVLNSAREEACLTSTGISFNSSYYCLMCIMTFLLFITAA